MAKKIQAIVKLQIEGGAATAAPPVATVAAEEPEIAANSAHPTTLT